MPPQVLCDEYTAGFRIFMIMLLSDDWILNDDIESY